MEVYTLEIIRIDSHTETVEPFFFIEYRFQCDSFRTPSGISPARLVDKIGGETFAKKYILKPFEGVQFSRDREALNQYFRQMTPTIGPLDFDVYSDAYAALFDKIGPAIFVTHSQGGPVGWFTLLKTKNIKAIVAYEPGGSVHPRNNQDRFPHGNG